MAQGAPAGPDAGPPGARSASPALRPLRWAGGAALLALALLAFYRHTLDLYFLGDDFVFLDRSRLDAWSDAPALFGVAKSQEGLADVRHAYRPLSTNVYFGALRGLFGLEPRAFHLANLVLAALNALLVQRLLVALGARALTAWAAAWIYASCSASFDGQLWLSVAQDLLVTGFALAAALAYLAWRRGGWRGAGAATLAATALALLSKETAVAVLPLLGALELLAVRRGAAGLRHLVPVAALVVGYAALRLGAMGLPARGPYALDLDATALANLARHLDWTGDALFLTRAPLSWAPFGLAAAAIAWAAPGRRRLAAVGLLWWAAALLPVLFLRDHAYRFYLILPVVGALLALSAAVDGLRDRLPPTPAASRAWLAATVGVLLLFTGQSQQRLREPIAVLGARGAAARSLLAQLRAELPRPPDGTRFYFLLPATLPRDALLKHGGAALRVTYDNPTLVAHRLSEPAPGAPLELPFGPGLVFRLSGEGELSRLAAPARASGG